MNFCNLLGHDLRSGLLRLRYLLIPCVLLLPCISFCCNLPVVGAPGTFGEFLLACFCGSRPVALSSPEEMMKLPVLWLLIMGSGIFLNLDYLLYDQENAGQQFIIRCHKRKAWYFSKCVWNLCSSFLYMGMSLLIIFLFTVISGGSSGITCSQQAANFFFQSAAEGMQPLLPKQILLTTVVLPILTLQAYSMLEMTLCLFMKPITSFLICMIILIISVYSESPWVLGNGAMVIRSGAIWADGIPLKIAIGLPIMLNLAAMVIGQWRFQTVDILGADS